MTQELPKIHARDLRLGDIVELSGSRGHVVGLPEPHSAQRCVLIYFFTGRAASARAVVSVVTDDSFGLVKRSYSIERGEAA